MADLLRGDHAHVNLIPMNPVAHTPWTASPMPVIERVRGDAPRRPASRRRSGATAARRSARPAASSRPSAPGEPPAPAVARRRERLVAESAAALRGERSHDPVPAGVGD